MFYLSRPSSFIFSLSLTLRPYSSFALPQQLTTMSRVHVSDHPLVATKLTQLRLHDLSAKDFREGVKALRYVEASVLTYTQLDARL